MRNKPKKVTLKQVAKAYKKNTKPNPQVRDASSNSRFEASGRIPTINETRVTTYKPKAMSATFGGTKNGKPATIRRRGRS